MGAYLAFLQEQEREGAFVVYDSERAAEFWKYFTAKHRAIPPEKVDYSRPWWEQWDRR